MLNPFRRGRVGKQKLRVWMERRSRSRSRVWRWEVSSCDYILSVSLTLVMVIIETYLGRSILVVSESTERWEKERGHTHSLPFVFPTYEPIVPETLAAH